MYAATVDQDLDQLLSPVAKPSLSRQLLEWKARHGADAMCADAWRREQRSDAR